MNIYTQYPHTNVSPVQSSPLTPLALVVVMMWSLYLFFLNRTIPGSFIDRSDDIEWYLVFANKLFEPTEMYIAESLLVPLLAKLLGASASLQGYRLLCAFFLILTLPTLLWVANGWFRSSVGAYLTVFVFSVSFKYFWSYQLGFPDPLAICLLCLVVVTKRSAACLIVVVLAGLTHFSMTLLALIALISCMFFVPDHTWIERTKRIKIIILGVFISKLMLICWGFAFGYQLHSRLGYVFNFGVINFYDRYLNNPIGFWLTPGWPYILVVTVSCLYFAMRKQFGFLIAQLFSIGMSYAAMFFTTDGLRVFAVVSAPTYFLCIAVVVHDLYQTNVHIFRRVHNIQSELWLRHKTCVSQYGAAAAASLAWLVFLYGAKERGWLVNHIAFLNVEFLSVSLYDLIFILFACLLGATLTSSKFRSFPAVFMLVKSFVAGVILLCIVQYVRQQNPEWRSPDFYEQLVAVLLIFLLAFSLAQTRLEVLVVRVFADAKNIVMR